MVCRVSVSVSHKAVIFTSDSEWQRKHSSCSIQLIKIVTNPENFVSIISVIISQFTVGFTHRFQETVDGRAGKCSCGDGGYFAEAVAQPRAPNHAKQCPSHSVTAMSVPVLQTPERQTLHTAETCPPAPGSPSLHTVIPEPAAEWSHEEQPVAEGPPPAVVSADCGNRSPQPVGAGWGVL